VASFEDITERKRTEELLHQTTAELERAHQRVRELEDELGRRAAPA
jgi:hypothetical protein